MRKGGGGVEEGERRERGDRSSEEIFRGAKSRGKQIV